MKQDLILLRETLLGALVGITRAMGGSQLSEVGTQVFLEGVLASAPESNETHFGLSSLLEAAHLEKELLAPDCKWCASPCGRTADLTPEGLYAGGDEVRRARLLLLAGARTLAGWIKAAGKQDPEAMDCLCRAVFALGEDWDADFLLSVAQETAAQAERCRAALLKTE